MARRVNRLTACATWVVLITTTSFVAGDDAGLEFFEKQVRPILAARCFECHSDKSDKPKGGLRLDSRAAALKGGDTGPAIVPGKPKESLLVDAINYGELYQMPPKSRLPAEEIAILTKWVEMGAPWPEEAAVVAAYAGEFDLAKRKAEHWCWQPIKPVLPPTVSNDAWAKQPLDRFILAKLEEKGLSPAPAAEPRTLIRRVNFDLIGLPPSPEEVEAFVAESIRNPQFAIHNLIDRLLASPHFGERWGRHWLDLVRYAETRGHEFDYEIPNAFEYRDYVIRALNADVPYDQVVLEHVAGDLIEQPRLHPTERFNESIIGTGFWFLGEWCHSPVDIRKDECERIDNMIDVFSKTFLGITVACARCHDHKFDAISQQDYYGLAGYLQSSSYRLTRFEQSENDRRVAAELQSLDANYRPRIAAAIVKGLRSRTGELAQSLIANAETLVNELGVPQFDLHGAETIVDYASLAEGPWMADGPTFGSGPVKPGQMVLTGDSDAPLEAVVYAAARRDLAIGDVEASAISQNNPGRLNSWNRAGRTLKTPTFTLKTGFVHYLIEGAGHVYAAVDSHAMINGPLHAELVKETGGNSDLPMRWITQDLSRYVGHRVHLEFSPKEDEDFRVLMVVEGRERPGAPANRANRLVEQIVAKKRGGQSEVATALCREVVEQTLDSLAANCLVEDPLPSDRAALVNWLVRRAAAEDTSALVADYAAAREKLVQSFARESRLCMAMWEGTPVHENVLIRGNHRTVGPVVERRIPEALQESGAGSRESGRAGRLELAENLVDPTNPLVSRVIVNRVWQHLMGRGIVPTVDNFGVLGETPTHPELLDYLADQFVREGWSVKRLIRRIMLSSTYCQESGLGGQESEAVDPENRWLHRQNVKRLEGEVLRDSILAVSGRLDRSMFGPSVPIYLTAFMQGRGRPKESGPLDGAGRRSIYVAVRRNFLSPMMLAFDTPTPSSAIGRRNVSNVPAQALILMNDPFVVEQCRHWARRVLAESNLSAADGIRRMYHSAFGREPTAAETSAATAFLDQQSREYGLDQANRMTDERLWADLGHVLLNVKEFLFVE